MSFADFSRATSRFVSDNTPAILTGVAIAGAISTAYFTGVATIKARDLYLAEAAENELREIRIVPTAQSTLKLVWKPYIPAATTLGLTIAAIICVNRVGANRTAAMAAAYSLSEKALSEYKDKVIEKVGTKKEEGIRDEIAQDRVTKNPPKIEHLHIGEGDVLFLDAPSGRPFKNTVEGVRSAQNSVNEIVLNRGGAVELSEFYILIGLEPTSLSDDLGWVDGKTMHIDFSSTILQDDRPCIVIDYTATPIRGKY